MKVDWDKRFFELAQHVSTWSKDRSTKVGAVIVDKENRVVSLGYNGFPTDFNDDIEERHERPAKYAYSEHAERNAIYNAARIGVTTKGCILYVLWFPCADCARAIIQSGIDTLVCERPNMDDERWGNSFHKSLEMLQECGVGVRYINSKEE
jgi:dCMP deaminase